MSRIISFWGDKDLWSLLRQDSLSLADEALLREGSQKVGWMQEEGWEYLE